MLVAPGELFALLVDGGGRRQATRVFDHEGGLLGSHLDTAHIAPVLALVGILLKGDSARLFTIL